MKNTAHAMDSLPARLPWTWLMVLLGMCAGSVSAATLYAEALTESNLLYYARTVKDGDTVVFPSGTVDLSRRQVVNSSINASVVWTNAVTLRFTAPTLIRNAITNVPSVVNYCFRFQAPSNAGISRITGATFSGNRTGSAISIGANQVMRVDHCNFVDIYGRGVFYWGYKAYGVVDHCSFTNNRIAVETDGGESASWRDPVDLGTTNGVVIEDCTFFNDSSGVPVDQLFYNGQGTRVLFRYNVVRSTSTNNVWFWDSHGNTRYLPAEARGTISTILENNTVDIYKCPKLISIRGGTCIIASNSLSVTTSSQPIVLTEEEGWSTSLFPTLITNWPAQDQITNSWIVNNTYKGAAVTNVFLNNSATDIIFIQENRDYWISRSPPPASIYVPLAYPHPLVSAQDGAKVPARPAPPRDLRAAP